MKPNGQPTPSRWRVLHTDSSGLVTISRVVFREWSFELGMWLASPETKLSLSPAKAREIMDKDRRTRE